MISEKVRYLRLIESLAFCISAYIGSRERDVRFEVLSVDSSCVRYETAYNRGDVYIKVSPLWKVSVRILLLYEAFVMRLSIGRSTIPSAITTPFLFKSFTVNL